MKTLETIHLVQFFLFEKDTFNVRGATGFLGPNGTGKSSLMDAIQLVMLGGNLAMARFNAQADSVSEDRNLRNYCLGVYMPQAGTAVRDHAHTYISLVYRDTVTGEPLSIGLHIEASHTQPNATIKGRYIFPGCALTLGDHLEAAEGGHMPIDWSVFRQNGIARSTGGALHDQPESFTREMLFYLRPKGGFAPDAKAFARAFRRSLALQTIENVDHAVRHYIVEDRPTDVNSFRRKVETFRQLRDKVRECEQQLSGAEGIQKQYERAKQQHARSVTWVAASAICAVDATLEMLDEVTQKQQESRGKLQRHEELVEEAGQKTAQLDQEWQTAWKKVSGHSEHIRREQRQLAMGHAQEKFDDAWKRVTDELNQIATVLREILTVESVEAANRAAAQSVLANIVKLSSSACPIERPEVLSLLDQSAQVASQARSVIEAEVSALEQQAADHELKARQVRVNAGRAAQGKAPLSEKAAGLLALLRAEGFSVEPVCDLIRFKDATWQPAVEAYLASNVEALLVAEADEEAAYDYCKALSSKYPIYGVKLALTSHALRYDRKPEAGEVAALVEGSSRAAVAFVRMQLGSLRCVDSAQQALGHRASLDKAGMLVKGGGLERLRLASPLHLKFGVVASRESKHQLEKEATDLEGKATQIKGVVIRRRTFLDQLSAVAANLEPAKKRIEADLAILEAVRTTLLELEREQAADVGLADEYGLLVGAEELARIALGLAKDATLKAERDTAAVRAQLQALDADVLRSKKAHDDANNASAAAAQKEGFDAELASEYRERLMNRDSADRHRHAESKSREAFEAAAREANQASAALGVFKAQYDLSIDNRCFDDRKLAAAWLEEFVIKLRDTEIHRYTQMADSAYDQAVRSFHMDVASTLADNFTRMDKHLSDLNRTLADAPMLSNGERYKFKSSVRKGLEDLQKFIVKVQLLGPGESLFGSAGEVPVQFRSVLEDHLSPQKGETNPIDDYRDFYDFDVEIQKGGKCLGSLSSRLGPGSGGEHRAPLYVIFGTALAAAYGRSGNNDAGAGVMLLDEAYDKMDPTNAKAMGRYLLALGLQPLLFAQDGAIGTLTPTMNSYYDMNRVDSLITYVRQDVHPQTHALLESDLPDSNPSLVAQEIVRMRVSEGLIHVAPPSST